MSDKTPDKAPRRIEIRFGEEDRRRLGLGDSWWHIRPSLMISEVRMVQAATGVTADRIMEHDLSDIEATAAFYWFQAKKAGVGIAYKDFDFDLLGLERREVADENPTGLP